MIIFRAHRESIKYLYEMENEKYELKLSEVQNRLNTSRIFNSNFEAAVDDEGESEEADEIEDITRAYAEFSNKEQSNPEVKTPSSSSSNSYREETDNEFNERYFYVDKYSNDQLKELIKLFICSVLSTTSKWGGCWSADFMTKAIILGRESDDKLKAPFNVTETLPSKLWIEKQPAPPESTYHFVQAQEFVDDKMTDFIEDNLEANLPQILSQSWKSLESKTEGEESEYLIYERHFDPQQFSTPQEKDADRIIEDDAMRKDLVYEDDINTEDLGIIDLEDDDVFDNIDDEKLPFLVGRIS